MGNVRSVILLQGCVRYGAEGLYKLFLFIFAAAPESGLKYQYCETYFTDGKTELGHKRSFAETTQMVNMESCSINSLSTLFEGVPPFGIQCALHSGISA